MKKNWMDKSWMDEFKHGNPPPQWYKELETVSQVISRLQEVISEVGDVPICMKGLPHESGSNTFFSLEALNDDDDNLFLAIGVHPFDNGTRLDI